MSVPTFEDVATAILTGQFDDKLEPLTAAIRGRKEIQSRAMFYELKHGDRVMINHNANPKYLQGRMATVMTIRQKKVTVDLDNPVGRFHRGIICPPDMLVLIPEATRKV